MRGYPDPLGALTHEVGKSLTRRHVAALTSCQTRNDIRQNGERGKCIEFRMAPTSHRPNVGEPVEDLIPPRAVYDQIIGERSHCGPSESGTPGSSVAKSIISLLSVAAGWVF